MTKKCSKCNGQLEYQPNTSLLKCLHCLSEENIDVSSNNNIPLHPLKNEISDITFNYNITKCSSCGAEIVEANFIVEQCPFCTSIIVNKEYINKSSQPIDGIIPFKITRIKAFEKIKKWKKRLYLCPNDYKKQILQVSFLKGTYIPYWLINSKTHVTYKGKCGQESLFSKKTRWSNESGELTTNLTNLTLLATKSIPEFFIDKSMPDFGDVISEPWNNKWDFNSLLPFNEFYTYGFTSEIPQISINKVLNKQEKKIKYELEQKVIEKIEKSGCDYGHVTKLSYEHIEFNYSLALLPVWIGAYKYKNKLYQILVNGQTGEVVGERPISKIKVLLMWAFVILLIIYGFIIISLENYWIWALHIAIIGFAIYRKNKKDKEISKNNL